MQEIVQKQPKFLEFTV